MWAWRRGNVKTQTALGDARFARFSDRGSTPLGSTIGGIVRPLWADVQLDHNAIVDLSPLSSLKYLRSLTLKANYITDVTPLKDLELLQELRLDDNPIEDTSVLEEMEFYDRFSMK